MRVPTTGHRAAAEIDLTPMIDVVFQLIIFFLLSSHLARQETQLELPLPAAASGREDLEEARPRITLNVRANGALLLGTAAVARSELPQRLQAEARRLGEQPELRIRADRSVPYAVIEPILLAAAQAGIWDVAFAVVERTEPRAE